MCDAAHVLYSEHTSSTIDIEAAGEQVDVLACVTVEISDTFHNFNTWCMLREAVFSSNDDALVANLTGLIFSAPMVSSELFSPL